MAVTISDAMIEAVARALFAKSEEASWLCDDRPNRPDETLEEYLDRLWKADDYEREYCTIQARAALSVVAPLIANAQIEACAEVARLAIYIAANQEYRTSRLRMLRSPSCVDYAKAADAAIRALKEK